MADPDRADADASGDARWRAALSALGGALLLDAADLLTFGPVGVWTGFAVGALLGWTMAPQLGFASRRWLPTLLAGFYCMLPGTALLPLATLFAGMRAWSAADASPPPAVRSTPPPPPAPDAIDVDYRSRWEASSGPTEGGREADPRAIDRNGGHR